MGYRGAPVLPPLSHRLKGSGPGSFGRNWNFAPAAVGLREGGGGGRRAGEEAANTFTSGAFFSLLTPAVGQASAQPGSATVGEPHPGPRPRGSSLGGRGAPGAA